MHLLKNRSLYTKNFRKKRRLGSSFSGISNEKPNRTSPLQTARWNGETSGIPSCNLQESFAYKECFAEALEPAQMIPGTFL